MQVTAVEAIPIRMGIIPLEEPGGLAPYVSSEHAHTSIDRTLIRVETSNGVVGWGEIRTPFSSASVTKSVIDDVIAPKIVGESVWEAFEALRGFSFTYLDIRPAIGGVEMALWDSLGRYLGEPLHRLLGGKQEDTVDVACCLGILSPEESAVFAEWAVDAGFEVLKTKAGRDWEDDCERVTAMARATNGRIDFRIDPNQGWSVPETVRVGARFANADVPVQYLEQPIRVTSFDTLRSLRDRSPIPLAINEDTYIPYNMYQTLVSGGVDACVVDMVPAGGVKNVLSLAGLAQEAGISLTHHCGFDLGIKTAAMLHVVASHSAFDLIPDTAYYAMEDDVVTDPLTIEDGALAVPDGPGLGVEVDPDLIEEYRL